MSRIASLICIALAVVACGKEPVPEPEPLLQAPDGFPDPIFPEGNELTEARWLLGKKLFFDPVLSRDSSISCASCHLPAFAFSDTTAFSPGVGGAPGTRNSPSLANVAYHPYFMREGGVPTLEMQILVPIQEHNEFDFNILLIAERLQRDSLYRAMSQAAYDREPDHFVITRAIACFERTLLSGGSAYDRDELSPAAERGRQLFFGEKTQCSQCHGGFNFTHYTFENNGLYEAYADPGRFRLTGLEEDRALFKVPSLRNVALTAPYMHDGSFRSLTEVIAHYNSGGAAHPHKNPLVRPLGLSPQERADLVAFLESLTDEAFVNNPLFRP
ncbi:MAG: cytochrome c peroxidase [Saprospiraceae bacterium]